MALKETHDKNIWNSYMQGFNDCFDKVDNSKEFHGLYNIAYKMGWDDSIIGDDVRSVDYRPKEETIQMVWDRMLKDIPFL